MEKDKVIANVFRDFSCWVGLDLSLTATGLSVLYQDIKLDGYRYTLTSPHKGPRRLSEFANHIKLAAEQILAYRPASEVLVCIENYAFSQFGKIVHLGELGGVVKQNLFDAGLSNILVYPPTTLKKFATGKGVAEKGLVMTNVYKRWDVDTSNNNEADAYVLSRLGHCLCYPETYTEFQREVSKNSSWHNRHAIHKQAYR